MRFVLCIVLTISIHHSNGRRLFSNGFLGEPSKIPLLHRGKEPLQKWFSQILDHSNPSKYPQWQQRYYVNDEFYKPGGPIFLRIGGESRANIKWMTRGAWIHYASELNALCFLLEHRFYGASRPTEDMSMQNLQYLTSRQALADLAHFVIQMKVEYNLKEKQRWITFGGSYPGSLAAWSRQKYPELIYGAVSSSAPLLAKVDFSEYFEVVRDSLASYSENCVTAVRKSVAQLENLLKHTAGQQEITEKFKLCDPIEKSIDNELDISNFFDIIAGKFAGVVQYNKDNTPNDRKTIDEVCDVMMNTAIGTPVQRLAEVIRILLAEKKRRCLHFKYDKTITMMKNTTWDEYRLMRQWTFQMCNEFGFFKTSNQKRDLFGNRLPLSFSIKQCMDIFSDKMDSKYLQTVVGETNKYYGALNPNTTNVLYVHGSIDPWHALGLVSSSNPNTPTIYIKGTAHCANVYEPTENDPPELTEARRKILTFIRSLLRRGTRNHVLQTVKRWIKTYSSLFSNLFVTPNVERVSRWTLFN